MIQSFGDRNTERLFHSERVRQFDAFAQPARRKLTMLHAATGLDELRSPPGNRLEALRGDRRGQHSIRINDQWRIVFVWREDGPHKVSIVDYH